jgi:TatD DNase family protein
VAPYPQVSISCGEHPLHQTNVLDADLLLKLAADPAVVAVGETGLDYFYSPESKSTQQQAFIAHIAVANQLQKPLIVHTRDAKADTLDILRQHQAERCGGVLHCFTEDWPTAKAALDLGFYISFSGIMTFRNADALRDVVRQVPLDRLLIETDSPYLAPVPFRGKTNQPAYVSAVAKAIAELHAVSVAELAKTTTDNFYRLFTAAKKTSLTAI